MPQSNEGSRRRKMGTQMSGILRDYGRWYDVRSCASAEKRVRSHWESREQVRRQMHGELPMCSGNTADYIMSCIFTALHGMQTPSSDENYVCLSVRLLKRKFCIK